MAVNPLYQTQVQTMYIAYFGRPADPAGLDYYTNLMASQGGGYAALLDDFFNSGEASGLYGALSVDAKINAFYQNLFGHTADPAGQTYWVNLINNHVVNLGQAAYTIAYNAQASDAASLAAKQTASATFTAHLDQATEVSAYQTHASAGRAFLAPVVSGLTIPSDASVDATILAMMGGGGSGTTFDLTTGIDNPACGAGNDTINGTELTFTGLDKIDGGGGVNTLNLTNVTKTTGIDLTLASYVKNIQKFNYESVQKESADVSGWTGLTDLNMITKSSVAETIKAATTLATENITNNGTGALSIVGGGGTLTVVSGGIVGVGDTNVANAFTSANIKAGGNVTVQDNLDATHIGTKLTSVSLDGSTAVGDITAKLTGNAISNISLSNYTGQLTLDTGTDTGVSVVDASGITAGNVSWNAGALKNALTMTGSGGNDFMQFSNAGTDVTANGGAGNDRIYASNDKTHTIDGGDGDDTIIVGDGNNTITGGSGNDQIIVGDGNNTITGGSGTDSIHVGKGSNHIDAGDGDNYVYIGAATARNYVTFGNGLNALILEDVQSSSSNRTIVTGMDKGDLIYLGVVTTAPAQNGILGAQTSIYPATGKTFTDYLNASTSGNASAKADINWFTFAGDTFIVVDDSAANTFQNGHDTVICLTGIHDLTYAANSNGTLTL